MYHLAFQLGCIAMVLTVISWIIEGIVAMYRRFAICRLRRLERKFIANARKHGVTYENREDFAFWSWIGDDV
jgi:hypothetical protein